MKTLNRILAILAFIGGILIVLLTYLRKIYQNEKSHRLQQLRSALKVFQSDNGHLEYQIVGTGQPILVFHGILGTYEHGRNAMWGFDLNHYQIIAISRLDYTLTVDQSQLSPHAYAQVIGDLLDHLNIEKVIVVAMSAGGPDGIQFSAQCPDRVSKLILLEAVTKPCELPRLGLLTSIGWLLRSIDSDPIAWFATHSIVKTLPLVGLVSTETREQILAYPQRRQVYETVTRSFFPTEFMTNGYMRDIDYLQRMEDLPLSQLTCPTLILHGRADEVVPLEHSEYAHQQIADSTLTIVENDADHDFHITHASIVWNAIFDFIKPLDQHKKVEQP